MVSQVRKAKRQVIFKRAEQYVNEYKQAEREQIRLNRAAKQQGDYFVPASPKVYFVMRIKGYVRSATWSGLGRIKTNFPLRINNIAPKPRKILTLLRLKQINNGCFVRVTKATSQMLLLVEPYITYGCAFSIFSFVSSADLTLCPSSSYLISHASSCPAESPT